MTVQVCLDDKSLINVHLHKKNTFKEKCFGHTEQQWDTVKTQRVSSTQSHELNQCEAT